MLLKDLGAILVDDPLQAEFRIRVSLNEGACEDVNGNCGEGRIIMADKTRPSTRESQSLVIYIGDFIDLSDMLRASGKKGVVVPLG